MKKAANFDEIKELFDLGEDTPERYRGFYRTAFGHDTALSADAIINMVAMSEDDDSPEGWANRMQELEKEELSATVE